MAAIEPFYPKGKGARRPPIGLTRMLRMDMAQQCCRLAATQAWHPHCGLRRQKTRNIGLRQATLIPSHPKKPPFAPLEQLNHPPPANHQRPQAPRARLGQLISDALNPKSRSGHIDRFV